MGTMSEYLSAHRLELVKALSMENYLDLLQVDSMEQYWVPYLVFDSEHDSVTSKESLSVSYLDVET